jgi:hypothetical protein
VVRSIKLPVDLKFTYHCDALVRVASADNFAVEQGKGEKAVAWMNEFANKNHIKFEAKLKQSNNSSNNNTIITTVKFGSFEFIAWKGEWSFARNIIKKASNKLKIKTLESGYHEKKDLLATMFGTNSEFAKVYSNGNLVGQIEMLFKDGKWVVKNEAYS